MRFSSFVMTLVMLAIFVVLVSVAMGYPPNARFMPFVVGIPAIALCLLQLVLDARRPASPSAAADPGAMPALPQAALLPAVAESEPTARETVRREAILWGHFLAFVAGVLLFGFWIAIPLFLISFLRFEAKASWRTASAMTLAATIVLFLGLETAFRIELHRGFVTEFLQDRLVGL